VLGGLTTVNEEHITRVTREQWAKLKGKTNWEKVKGMSEAEIAKNALEDPDNPPLPADFSMKASAVNLIF
jgi:hypothetical protein